MQDVMTKEKEIELITSFYDSLPADSYLKMLLNGLPEYCEGQIRNDWAINPLETLKESDDKLQELQVSVDQLKLQKEQLSGEFQEVKNHRDRIYDEREEAMECNRGLTEANLRLGSEVQELKDTILELKAELYDYIKGIK